MGKNPFPVHKGFIRDLTDSQLIEELNHWQWETHHAKTWGAAVGAANEFRKAAAREIEKRGILT